MTDELPPGWAQARIGDVAHYVRGVTYTKEHASKSAAHGLTAVLRANNIGQGLSFDDLVFVPDRFISEEQIVSDGDVVLAMSSGSKSVVGKAAVAKTPPRCGFGAFCGVIRPSLHISHSLLGYYFQTKAYRNAVAEESKGVNINNLKAEHILGRQLALPPKPEQDRIASKIDELFSRIDEGERALAQVQTLVERYRQSVLKAAVTGELTREWREKNKDKLESGETLLTRILSARREAWEKAELDKMKAKGITPANDNWKQKYKEPSPPDKSDLPELPELPDGWTWCSGAQLFEWASGDFLPAKAMQPGDVPVYGGNGVNGQHSEANVDFATVVVGRVGVHCGNVHISASRSWVTDNAIYATRLPTLASLAFLLICLRSAQLGKTSQGGAQPFVNQKSLNEVAVPLPSVEEQVAAVDVLATETSRLDAVLASVDAESKRMAVLKQAVLKCAFFGALVAQDPADEPASALLERIAAERGTDNAAPKRGRKKKTAA